MIRFLISSLLFTTVVQHSDYFTLPSNETSVDVNRSLHYETGYSRLVTRKRRIKLG